MEKHPKRWLYLIVSLVVAFVVNYITLGILMITACGIESVGWRKCWWLPTFWPAIVALIPAWTVYRCFRSRLFAILIILAWPIMKLIQELWWRLF